MGEEEIVKSLKERDEKAFISVVDAYKKKVMALCFSYVKDYQEAEDMSQEVFISLYKSISNFRGESSLSTYIYKIAVSKCLDYKRKRSIKGFLNGLFMNSPESTEDIVDKNYVRDLVKNLPDDMKLPVILYYYIGLKEKEIAQILNISMKAVEGRIYRAKKLIKREYEKEGFLLCRKGTI